MNTRDLVFLDFESTGLDVNTDRIISVGLLHGDKAFKTLVRPCVTAYNSTFTDVATATMLLPPKITELTGITDAMCLRCGTCG